jgi:hypothetical protein
VVGDLALYPLERVVHGLAVTPKAPADLFIGVPVEIQGQDLRLELRERG